MHRVFTRALFITAVASVPAWAQQTATQSAAPSAAPSGREARATNQQQPPIEPRAEQVMRQMSDYMAGLRTMRVDTRAVDEVVLQSGQKVQQITESRLTVARPNKVHSQRIGPSQDVDFKYNGREFDVVSTARNYYATVEAPPTLDDAIDVLRERYGIEVPAADLLVSRPYDALMHDARTGRYVGMEPINGVQAHHLAFTGPEVDWQIWVRDGNEPLPLRFVITSKTERSQPEFAVDLTNWQSNPRVADNEFEFTPPANARRIQILPTRPAASAARAPERQGR